MDGLERSCGPGRDWELLETTMTLDKAPDAKVRWIVNRTTIEIVQLGPTLRAGAAARPDGSGVRPALEQVQSRQVVRVPEAPAEHIKTLVQAGYQKKFALFHRGKQFVWGKASVFVSQVFVPSPTNTADFTRRQLAQEWCVRAVVYCAAASEAEEAAATLVGIQHVLRDRVALFK
jgi:hypothetical protein